MLSDENLQRLSKALFPVAILLILVPFVDIGLSSLAGAEVGSLQWRFGVAGRLLGNLGTIVLGTGLLAFLAGVADNRGTLRATGIWAIVLAALLVALLVLFGLDAVQVRKLVVAQMKRGILVSSASAATAGIVSIFALLTLGRGALTASRRAAAPGRRVKTSPSPLVSQAAPAARPRAEEPV